VISLMLLIASACTPANDPDQPGATTPVVVETLPTETLPTQVSPVVPSTTNSPPVISPTSTPVDTPETEVEKPTQPVPTPTPEIILAELAPGSVSISQCRISGDLELTGFSRTGTAPAPTPSPVSADSGPQEDLVSELRAEVDPIIAALIGFNTALHNAWPYADTAEKRAAQLHIFGNRLAQLCSAMSLLTVPNDAFDKVAELAESMRARHTWVMAVVDELTCCSDARTDGLDVDQTSSYLAIVASTTELNDFFDNYLGNRNVDSERSIVNKRFGLTMLLGNHPVVVRNTVDFLVIFAEDSKILGAYSLGPDGWNDGTSIRIRRLRNRTEFSVPEAITQYENLLTRFGDPNPDNYMDVPMLNGIRIPYPPFENSWSGSVTVFVEDGFTYFVESMCRPGEPDLCEFVDASIDSIRHIN